MVRRDGSRVRCFTRNGHDWADRFPAIVDAALRIKATPFLIDGEVVVVRDDGAPDFHALRGRGHEALLYAFDLIEHDGDDLRDLPLIERKRQLARLIGKTKNAGDPVRYASEGEQRVRVGACLPIGAGGDFVEAGGCALSPHHGRVRSPAKSPLTLACSTALGQQLWGQSRTEGRGGKRC